MECTFGRFGTHACTHTHDRKRRLFAPAGGECPSLSACDTLMRIAQHAMRLANSHRPTDVRQRHRHRHRHRYGDVRLSSGSECRALLVSAEARILGGQIRFFSSIDSHRSVGRIYQMVAIVYRSVVRRVLRELRARASRRGNQFD